MKDPFFLERFVNAQKLYYARALGEIRQGHKQTHWIWFIFPQIGGMGSSIDVLKLQASMTLFAEAEPENTLFSEVLKKYYKGQKHKRTLQLLGIQ